MVHWTWGWPIFKPVSFSWLESVAGKVPGFQVSSKSVWDICDFSDEGPTFFGLYKAQKGWKIGTPKE